MNIKQTIFIAILSGLLNISAFSQGFDAWETLYKESQLTVEVQFKIEPSSCLNSVKNKIQYKLTGKLSSFDYYLIWSTDYKDCSGNTYFQEHSLNMSTGNASANGSVDAFGDTWPSIEDEFFADEVLIKFYNVHSSSSPSNLSGIKGVTNPLNTMSNFSFQKVAFINLDSLVSLMPESKILQNTVADYATELEQQVVTMQNLLQKKYEAFQKTSLNMSSYERSSKEKEMNDLNQRITDFQQKSQVDYKNKSAELSKPVYEKAKRAIRAVAIANGYKYVLDTSTGLVLYTVPSDDIISLVIKKLEIIIPSY